jgi:hypothetical protein
MKIELTAQKMSEFGAVYWKQFRHAGIEHFLLIKPFRPKLIFLGLPHTGNSGWNSSERVTLN